MEDRAQLKSCYEMFSRKYCSSNNISATVSLKGNSFYLCNQQKPAETNKALIHFNHRKLNSAFFYLINKSEHILLALFLPRE